MISKFTTTIFFLLLSINSFAGVLWYCSATNTDGAVWNQYGLTRINAQTGAANKCKPFNKHQKCTLVCFPPLNYWRCESHDILPLDIDQSTSGVTFKQGTWYWTSYSKQVAINGARDACRHNSGFGGCYVNPDSCATS